MKTIEQRIKHVKTVTKSIDGFPYDFQELSLAIEGRTTNLRVWINNEICIADQKKGLPNKVVISMRLDKFEAYSAPLSKDTAMYIHDGERRELMFQLAKKFPFGQVEATTDNLFNLFTMLEGLKERECLKW